MTFDLQIVRRVHLGPLKVTSARCVLHVQVHVYTFTSYQFCQFCSWHDHNTSECGLNRTHIWLLGRLSSRILRNGRIGRTYSVHSHGQRTGTIGGLRPTTV